MKKPRPLEFTALEADRCEVHEGTLTAIEVLLFGDVLPRPQDELIARIEELIRPERSALVDGVGAEWWAVLDRAERAEARVAQLEAELEAARAAAKSNWCKRP